MKKVILLSCLALITGLLLFSPGQGNNPALAATAISIEPSDDAFVWSNNPSTSYGSLDILSLRNGANELHNSYLKFTVQGLEAPVQQATLYLYAQRNSNSTSSVYLVSNHYAGSSQPWQENLLTWQNAPALTGTPLSSVDRARSGSWVAFDVSAAVTGNATYSFGLSNSSANTVEFAAKEAASNRPVLIIETGGDGAGLPDPTATAAPTLPPSATNTPAPTATVPPTATATAPPPTATPPPAPSGGIWLSAAELAALPASGTAWNNLLNAAQRDTSQPNISDQNDRTDVDVLAKALVYARTGDSRYRNEAITGIMAAIGTEGDATTGILAVGRNTMPYVIAADLVNLPANSAEDQVFRAWLANLRHSVFSGGGSHSLISCHEQRPNNFGTHCGASRIAIALYLGDSVELDRAATVFRGWLGDRNAYTGFSFGDLSWQCNSNQPVGINPAGCTRDGHSIDGVLPDDQRRGGAFTWPPPKENYVWEGLQGAVVQAQLLHRAGYPAWEWQDRALLRAVTWLHSQANFPAEGDDRWQPWLVNYAYGTNFPAPSPTSPGKGMAWTDWTHAR
jgi:hypothetical protein